MVVPGVFRLVNTRRVRWGFAPAPHLTYQAYHRFPRNWMALSLSIFLGYPHREKRSVTTRRKHFLVFVSGYGPMRSKPTYSQGHCGRRGISCLRAAGWVAFARQHSWQVADTTAKLGQKYSRQIVRRVLAAPGCPARSSS